MTINRSALPSSSSQGQPKIMPTFLGIPSEIRCLIYHHLFKQPHREILALSREPQHNYENGPPTDWIADSRQEGLVYGSETLREQPTNSYFLHTCRTIHEEATSLFYSTNKISLYAEDNNDIFYWLLDIGERNRRAIRHLEIGWAYGVSIQSGRGNLHGILENIEYMEDSAEEEIQKHRAQLITLVQRLESKTVRLMIRTLSLLASNQDLISLTVYLPGVDGGDIWDLRNPNLYFADEIFSNSTQNVHTCIPHALSKMLGIKTLTIGYTKDIALAEKIARSTGAKELNIETCLEGHKLFLNEDEQAHWRSKGWRLEGKVARKRLLVDVGADEEDASLVKQEITSKLDEDNSKYQVAGRAKQEIKKRRIQR